MRLSKTMFPLILISLLAAGSCSTFAADAAKQLTPQQQRMKDCNAEAKTKALAGAERKTFMSSCLKGEAAASAGAKTPQEKMKVCNTEASGKNLKGDERKTFMSHCLKSDGAAAAAH